MTKMSKILIIYASSGAGHRKAAEAIKAAFDASGAKNVEIIDSLDYTNKTFKFMYPATYLFLVHFIPLLWGFFYYLSDNRKAYYLISKLRRISNWMNSKRLVKYILDAKPDVVVFTHFFASEVIANLKRKGEFRGRLVTVITDYGLHSFWISGEIDTYIVGFEDTKVDLMRRGMPQNKIKVLGIPVDIPFIKDADKFTLRQRLGIERDKFTALVISGGFGVGPMKELVCCLGSLPLPMQLLVVCGKNPLLYQDLTRLKDKFRVQVKLYQFVNNVDELMGASDVVITKAGGLTSTEALAKGLPLVIVSPIPGQETKNCNLLARYGVAIKLYNIEGVCDKIIELFDNKELLAKMRENITRIRRPNAAFDIVRFINEGRAAGDSEVI